MRIKLAGAALLLGIAANQAPSAGLSKPEKPEPLDQELFQQTHSAPVIGNLGTSTTIRIEAVMPDQPKAPTKLESPEPTQSVSMDSLPVAQAQEVIEELLPQLEESGLQPITDTGGNSKYDQFLVANDECAALFTVSRGDHDLPVVTPAIYGPLRALRNKAIVDKDGTADSQTIHDEFPFDAPEYKQNDESSAAQVIAYVEGKLQDGCNLLERNGKL
jgi:hypothetical protein